MEIITQNHIVLISSYITIRISARIFKCYKNSLNHIH
jgi:hypothetical protein